jgi:hypothetical protein
VNAINQEYLIEGSSLESYLHIGWYIYNFYSNYCCLILIKSYSDINIIVNYNIKKVVIVTLMVRQLKGSEAIYTENKW